MARVRSKRTGPFRMSWLGWLMVALGVWFLGTLLLPLPLERSDGPAVLLYLAIVVPTFFGLNWLALRDERWRRQR